MQVKEIMSSNPACCTQDTPLNEVARIMLEHDCGAIPVVDSKESLIPEGIITDRDIVCRIVSNGQNPADHTVSDCITSPCISIDADADLEDCLNLMEDHRLRRVIVVDESGRCCGIVSQADIAMGADETQTGEVVREVSQPSEGISPVHRSA